MQDSNSIGDKIAAARKLRGMSQRDLAEKSGVSYSLIRKLEEGTYEARPRVETARRLAKALKRRTSELITGGDAEPADEGTVQAWAAARDAVEGRYRGPDPDEPATPAGVLAAVEAAKPALAGGDYMQLCALMPEWIRDARHLDPSTPEGAAAASRAMNIAGWLLTMNRQWEASEAAATVAMDVAGTDVDRAAGVNTLVWSLLRQGRLGRALELAATAADEVEPRMSTARKAQLAAWGRLQLGMTNALIRDNRAREAAGALNRALAAADLIGREVPADPSTARSFGPVTVEMIRGENAALSSQPEEVLAIAAGVQARARGLLYPKAASWCRHQLDVANALVMLRRHGEAVDVMMQLRDESPQWLPQQRYAADILGCIVRQRRTLDTRIRELAETVHLAL